MIHILRQQQQKQHLWNKFGLLMEKTRHFDERNETKTGYNTSDILLYYYCFSGKGYFFSHMFRR